MATVNSATLESSKTGGNILFQANVNMQFEARELNSLWELRMSLWEDDYVNDDRLGSEIKTTFRPNSTTVNRQMAKRLSKSTVDTEWGDEEVYGKITLVPLESPQPFKAASAQTGIEAINE